jgi:hypothetical protein
MLRILQLRGDEMRTLLTGDSGRAVVRFRYVRQPR